MNKRLSTALLIIVMCLVVSGCDVTGDSADQVAKATEVVADMATPVPPMETQEPTRMEVPTEISTTTPTVRISEGGLWIDGILAELLEYCEEASISLSAVDDLPDDVSYLQYSEIAGTSVGYEYVSAMELCGGSGSRTGMAVFSRNDFPEHLNALLDDAFPSRLFTEDFVVVIVPGLPEGAAKPYVSEWDDVGHVGCFEDGGDKILPLSIWEISWDIYKYLASEKVPFFSSPREHKPLVCDESQTNDL